MFKPKLRALAVMATVMLPICAHAQSTEVLDQIRQEIQDLKKTYETRIQELEQRLKAAEQAAAKAQSAATQAQQSATKAETTAQQAESAAQKAEVSAAQAPAAVTGPASANVFNPGISLILNGSYQYYSQNPEDAAITGYIPPGGRDIGPRGFSLDESELTLSAAVDQLFYAQATFSVEQEPGETSIGVEEAYFLTSALGHGLTVKAGQFFSALGYFNPVHAHAWDFFDAALPQSTFLGNNLAVTGLQATWVAPLPVFVELGVEADRPVGFPFPESDPNSNGIPSYTLFARVGGDIGTSHSYRVGAWWLQADNDLSEGVPLLDFDESFTFQGGDTKLWGLDFVYKWAPDGNPVQRNFKFVAEWMQRRIDDDLTFDDGVNPAATGPFKVTQNGWYAQGVYQFIPQWRVGLRYDQLSKGSYDVSTPLIGLVPPNSDYTPYRWSTMVDWSPSEFSRIRLQYNYDKTQQGVTNNEVFLQYIMSLGVHGAHKF